MNKISAFLKSARFFEVSIMLGFPMTGLFFAFETPEQLFSGRSLLFVGAIFLLFTAIYAFNGLAGISEDEHNERLSDLKGRRRSFIATLAVSLVLSFALFFFLDPLLLLLAVVSFILWSIYAFPKKGFKYRPILGTLIHFVGQIIHFLMGHMVLAPITQGSALLSVYFALLFSSGHLNHELIDHDADEQTGIRTGAVVFGVKKWEKASFFLFSLSAAYITALSFCSGKVMFEALPFAAAGIIHIIYKICVIKRAGKQQKFIAERSFYRVLYFAAGILCVAAKTFDVQQFFK